MNRECSAFLFLCGFGVEAYGTGVSPRAKEKSPSETTDPAETRSKRFVKLKPRKQVKEPNIKTLVIIQETPQLAQKRITKGKEAIQEQSTSRSAQKILTRSQLTREKGKTVVSEEDPSLKGSLNDILQAIDIEESPLVQEDFINLDEGKSKKIKSSKKMDFNDDISEFVFKPRRHLTRN